MFSPTLIDDNTYNISEYQFPSNVGMNFPLKLYYSSVLTVINFIGYGSGFAYLYTGTFLNVSLPYPHNRTGQIFTSTVLRTNLSNAPHDWFFKTNSQFLYYSKHSLYVVPITFLVFTCISIYLGFFNRFQDDTHNYPPPMVEASTDSSSQRTKSNNKLAIQTYDTSQAKPVVSTDYPQPQEPDPSKDWD